MSSPSVGQIIYRSCPIGMNTPKYEHQTCIDTQTRRRRGRHMTWASKVLLGKWKGPRYMVEWGCGTEPCALSLPSLTHLCPASVAMPPASWGGEEKARVWACMSLWVCVFLDNAALRALFSLWHNAASVEKILGTKNKLDSGAGCQNY